MNATEERTECAGTRRLVMAPTVLPREQRTGICPVCGRTVAVKVDGRVREHRPAKTLVVTR